MTGLGLCRPLFPEESVPHTPKLLLTAQRLRRLERDRTRQTVRWTNFDNRVNTVPDSPERGLELALYYAITHDEKRGSEAVAWALAHPSERRQVAFVLDWCAALISANDKQRLVAASSAPGTGSKSSIGEQARDALFLAIALDRDLTEAASPEWKQVLDELRGGAFEDGAALFAACEYLTAVRSAQHVDLRRDDPKFFLGLPVEFLLSLRPPKVQSPDRMTHLAALALVALDPNSESAQFLQGWAIEDRQMLRDGPGVAEELLWADPYLPGVGYQNLDPWIYDTHGRLFARSAWTADACWIALSSSGVDQENCPNGWQSKATDFGHLTLIPVAGRCLDVPRRTHNNDAAILWKLAPRQPLSYVSAGRKEQAEADRTGLWRVPENAEGQVCTLDKLKRP